jgi:cyclohexanone monooxygenase
VDCVVVGAGIGGLYMLHRLRGLGLSARVFEDAPDVGGTWYWNRYPGARVDIPSMVYSYSFSDEIQQEWEWTEEFAAQPEILRYLNYVADKLDLRRDISFQTRVESAVFDEAKTLWEVRTNRGEVVWADYVVMATGNLSAPHYPDIPGLDRFEGELYHSARWPEGVDLTNKRVGIIGTGSTGIQIIQTIAPQVSELLVFQRTPAYSIPARNKPMSPERDREIKDNYAEIRRKSFAHPIGGTAQMRFGLRDLPEAERDAQYQKLWETGAHEFMAGFPEMLINKEENDIAAEFIRSRIRETVGDQEVARLLCPTDYHVGTRRLCLDIGYYETYNRDNVTLVDVRGAPIEEITPTGLRTSNAHYDLDVLIIATGFDAITGALMRIDIRGRDGLALKEKWANGPRTYLGFATAGFPNLFIMNGPSSPAPLTNFYVSIEHGVKWIADCISHQRQHGLSVIEATPAAEDKWMQHVHKVADKTLFPTANSWLMGANIPGKPRQMMVYVAGFPAYVERCDTAAADGYAGFVLTGQDRAAAA